MAFFTHDLRLLIFSQVFSFCWCHLITNSEVSTYQHWAEWQQYNECTWTRVICIHWIQSSANLCLPCINKFIVAQSFVAMKILFYFICVCSMILGRELLNYYRSDIECSPLSTATALERSTKHRLFTHYQVIVVKCSLGRFFGALLCFIFQEYIRAIWKKSFALVDFGKIIFSCHYIFKHTVKKKREQQFAPNERKLERPVKPHQTSRTHKSWEPSKKWLSAGISTVEIFDLRENPTTTNILI